MGCVTVPFSGGSDTGGGSHDDKAVLKGDKET